MANGRGDPKRKKNAGRDPGGFATLPWSVLDSEAYIGLTVHAKALLLEVARQFHGDDNGRMLLSRAYLLPRGWNSNDMLLKATRELCDAGLIFRTVMGQRPNKASWYAMTWQRLDKIPGFDPGAAESFEQGAYRRNTVAQPLANGSRNSSGTVAGGVSGVAVAVAGGSQGASKGPPQIAALTPPHGTESTAIAPPHGVETPSPTPPRGAIRAFSGPLSTPPHGHPLEKPSAGAVFGAGVRS